MNHIIKKINNIYERVNPIEGGVGDDLDIPEVDHKELIIGISVEKEHENSTVKYTAVQISKFLDDDYDDLSDEDVKNMNTRMDIALDHLSEIPDYYTRLDKMEKEAKPKE